MVGTDDALRKWNFGKPLFALCEAPGFGSFEAPVAAKLIPATARFT
jgi:hypothetical protein